MTLTGVEINVIVLSLASLNAPPIGKRDCREIWDSLPRPLRNNGKAETKP